MTPAQQAELEQVAREWVAQHELVFKGDVRSLITLLAAQRAKWLEDAANALRDEVMYGLEDEAYDNEVGKDGDGTSRNQGVNAAIQYLLRQAQEQRP